MITRDMPPPGEQPEECESCQFETKALKAYENFRYRCGVDAGKGESHRWLCALCASTMAGNAAEYPEQYRDGHAKDVMMAVCYVGNVILAALAGLSQTIPWECGCGAVNSPYQPGSWFECGRRKGEVFTPMALCEHANEGTHGQPCKCPPTCGCREFMCRLGA